MTFVVFSDHNYGGSPNYDGFGFWEARKCEKAPLTTIYFCHFSLTCISSTPRFSEECVGSFISMACCIKCIIFDLIFTLEGIFPMTVTVAADLQSSHELSQGHCHMWRKRNAAVQYRWGQFYCFKVSHWVHISGILCQQCFIFLT